MTLNGNKRKVAKVTVRDRDQRNCQKLFQIYLFTYLLDCSFALLLAFCCVIWHIYSCMLVDYCHSNITGTPVKNTNGGQRLKLILMHFWNNLWPYSCRFIQSLILVCSVRRRLIRCQKEFIRTGSDVWRMQPQKSHNLIYLFKHSNFENFKEENLYP